MAAEHPLMPYMMGYSTVASSSSSTHLTGPLPTCYRSRAGIRGTESLHPSCFNEFGCVDWDEGCWGRRGALFPPPKKCCVILTPIVDPGGKPCSRSAHGSVVLKEANGTAQTRAAGALCMKDDGGVHSWGSAWSRKKMPGSSSTELLRWWLQPKGRTPGADMLLHGPGDAAVPCPTAAHLVPQPKNPVSAYPPVFVLMSSPSTYTRSYF